ncbi:hypothetical protein [Massilia eburnea]|uniref:hypothetical protein n=1 Tax=Massilia eburnea TaxID=1776165 RepID=UPI003D6B04C5
MRALASLLSRRTVAMAGSAVNSSGARSATSPALRRHRIGQRGGDVEAHRAPEPQGTSCVRPGALRGPLAVPRGSRQTARRVTPGARTLSSSSQ